MDTLVALAVISILVFILISAHLRDINACDFILLLIAAVTGAAMCNGWNPGLTDWVVGQMNGPSTESMTPIPDKPDMPGYETEYSYDPVLEYWGAEITGKTEDFDQGNSLYYAAGDPSDFDNYGMKGYIPGYSDVYLYNKDGSDPFADLYRGATEEGRLRWGNPKPEPADIDIYRGDGDPFGTEFSKRPNLNRMMRGIGGRADNHASQLHAKQQLRAKENLVNSSRNNRRSWEKFYRKELDESGEKRVWWETDNLYHPIQQLS